jgi:glutathione transport system substrate-binding protein
MQTEAPRSMDPADHTASFTSSVLSPMYEGLTRFTDTLELAPSLAMEWTGSADGGEWSFRLREGVVFHDGTNFDAAAVVASFQRHIDPKRGLASSGRFRAVIAEVIATSPTYVTFKLKSPYPPFLRLLATNNASIVSPKADAAGTLGRQAVGTGPFKFSEWSSGDYVLQARNDAYWGEKAPTEMLKWTWSSEAAVLNMAARTGDADVVSPLPPAFASQVKGTPDLRLIAQDGSAVFWIALNTQIKPLDDVRVRQALNFATDRDALVRVLLYGYATPAESPLSPVTLFFDPTLKPYPFDVARAKSLLAEAGYPNGISINVAVQEPQANLAEALQGMWAAAGITLDVLRMEGGVWTQAAFGGPEQKAQQKLNSVLASWSTGFIDPDLQLRPLYQTRNWSPKGPNLGFYSNPALDTLLDEAGSTTDPDKRKPLYLKAQAIIQADAPHVLLYVPQDIAAVAAPVKDLWIIPGGQVMASGAKRV